MSVSATIANELCDAIRNDRKSDYGLIRNLVTHEVSVETLEYALSRIGRIRISKKEIIDICEFAIDNNIDELANVLIEWGNISHELIEVHVDILKRRSRKFAELKSIGE